MLIPCHGGLRGQGSARAPRPGVVQNAHMVHANRHHAHRLGAFGVQHVERVAQELKEFVGGIERSRLLDVVGREPRKASQDVGCPRDQHVIWKLVTVGAAVIKKSALPNDATPRVGTRTIATIPAVGWLAKRAPLLSTARRLWSPGGVPRLRANVEALLPAI
jgi:hypothetical protein